LATGYGCFYRGLCETSPVGLDDQIGESRIEGGIAAKEFGSCGNLLGKDTASLVLGTVDFGLVVLDLGPSTMSRLADGCFVKASERGGATTEAPICLTTRSNDGLTGLHYGNQNRTEMRQTKKEGYEMRQGRSLEMIDLGLNMELPSVEMRAGSSGVSKAVARLPTPETSS